MCTYAFLISCFSPRNLYPKFASPWASAPCRPQDIGMMAPPLTLPKKRLRLNKSLRERENSYLLFVSSPEALYRRRRSARGRLSLAAGITTHYLIAVTCCQHVLRVKSGAKLPFLRTCFVWRGRATRSVIIVILFIYYFFTTHDFNVRPSVFFLPADFHVPSEYLTNIHIRDKVKERTIDQTNTSEHRSCQSKHRDPMSEAVCMIN